MACAHHMQLTHFGFVENSFTTRIYIYNPSIPEREHAQAQAHRRNRTEYERKLNVKWKEKDEHRIKYACEAKNMYEAVIFLNGTGLEEKKSILQ